jgi:hypothetical protein
MKGEIKLHCNFTRPAIKLTGKIYQLDVFHKEEIDTVQIIKNQEYMLLIYYGTVQWNFSINSLFLVSNSVVEVCTCILFCNERYHRRCTNYTPLLQVIVIIKIVEI